MLRCCATCCFLTEARPFCHGPHNAAPFRRLAIQFAILDGRVLINGSFNWTRGAATSNCENLTMTNATPLVRSFQEEFNRLWAQFSR